MCNPRKTDVELDCMNIASLLAKGDKPADKIQKRLKLSSNRWHNARRKMQEDGRLGTIPGKPVLYTLIKRAGESAVQGRALAPRRKSAFWKHVVFMKGG